MEHQVDDLDEQLAEGKAVRTEGSPIRILGYDDSGWLVDNLNRRQPTGFNLKWAFAAIPGFAREFSTAVPDEFWSRDVNDDGHQIARVACPCQEEPEVRPGRAVVCDCDRCYLHLGSEVRVANSPKA